MGGKGSGVLSQSGKAKLIQKVVDLSERKLIDVLEGRTNLPEKAVVSVALEIYKRRVPSKIEKSEPDRQNLTMIKVVKNYVPGSCEEETIDITPSSQTKKINASSKTKNLEDAFDRGFKIYKSKKPVKEVLAGDFSENE